MNSSAKNHYEKDLKPPSLSSQPYQKDIKLSPPSSQPFDQTSTTGYPVIDPPSAPPPLHIQSQCQVPWSTGLCDCCQDVGTCCLTCWCPCITFGRIVDIVDRGSTCKSFKCFGAVFVSVNCYSNGIMGTEIMCVTVNQRGHVVEYHISS